MPDGSTPFKAPPPQHSPLGASSAERWLECPGSVALIKALGPDIDNGSEYAEEGTRAHALGAYCLNNGVDCWEALDQFPDATGEMADAVQTYLDYASSRIHDRRYVEFGVAHQAFHPSMFGTLDCIALCTEPMGGPTELIDYKHGVGVVVEPENNPQLMYYAFAFIDGEEWPADLARLPDDHVLRLTIVQPRGWMEPIRSWETTCGAVRNWAFDTLHAAMQRAGEETFKLGEHCRFCPAKLVCPAMRNVVRNVDREIENGVAIEDVSDEWLGEQFEQISVRRMFDKMIEAQVLKRALDGKDLPGVKLVYAKVFREWKQDAGPEIERIFGKDAYKTELRSPAQIQALPGGPDFVAEWSQKPEAGLTVATLSDKRPAQKPVTNEEVFAHVTA